MCKKVPIQLLYVSQLYGYFFTYYIIGTKVNASDNYHISTKYVIQETSNHDTPIYAREAIVTEYTFYRLKSLSENDFGIVLKILHLLHLQS